MRRHIRIILDGNRRYRTRQRLDDPRVIYALGARKLDQGLEWCAEFAVRAATLWVPSSNNLGPPAAEASGIVGAVETKLKARAKNPRIHRRRVRVRAIGRLDRVPVSAVAAVDAARDATASHDGMTLTIAVAYDGREEIVDAVRALLAEEARNRSSLANASERVTPQRSAGIAPPPRVRIRT